MTTKNSKKTTQSPLVHCAHTRIADAQSLKPHPRNPNKHPDAQLSLLGKVIMANGWRAPIVVSRLSGFVIKGHARLEVALTRGWKEVPVDEQDYATEADEMADLVADNKIQELSETDDAELQRILEDFADDDEERFGLLEEDDEQPDIVPADLKPPPRMGWILIGAPIEEFGQVQQFAERLPDHFHVSTTTSDQGADEKPQG